MPAIHSLPHSRLPPNPYVRSPFPAHEPTSNPTSHRSDIKHTLPDIEPFDFAFTPGENFIFSEVFSPPAQTTQLLTNYSNVYPYASDNTSVSLQPPIKKIINGSDVSPLISLPSSSTFSSAGSSFSASPESFNAGEDTFSTETETEEWMKYIEPGAREMSGSQESNEGVQDQGDQMAEWDWVSDPLGSFPVGTERRRKRWGDQETDHQYIPDPSQTLFDYPDLPCPSPDRPSCMDNQPIPSPSTDPFEQLRNFSRGVPTLPLLPRINTDLPSRSRSNTDPSSASGAELLTPSSLISPSSIIGESTGSRIASPMSSTGQASFLSIPMDLPAVPNRRGTAASVSSASSVTSGTTSSRRGMPNSYTDAAFHRVQGHAPIQVSSTQSSPAVPNPGPGPTQAELLATHLTQSELLDLLAQMQREEIIREMMARARAEVAAEAQAQARADVVATNLQVSVQEAPSNMEDLDAMDFAAMFEQAGIPPFALMQEQRQAEQLATGQANVNTASPSLVASMDEDDVEESEDDDDEDDIQVLSPADHEAMSRKPSSSPSDSTTRGRTSAARPTKRGRKPSPKDVLNAPNPVAAHAASVKLERRRSINRRSARTLREKRKSELQEANERAAGFEERMKRLEEELKVEREWRRKVEGLLSKKVNNGSGVVVIV